MKQTIPVITIDGPSGTGKGTVSGLVANVLNWNLLDSGVLYRALAMAAKQHAVELNNEKALKVLAAHLDVLFKPTNDRKFTKILLEGNDVTDSIRTEEWGNAASQVAQLPYVRQALLERQRSFQIQPGLVADGRDMGTVIFPDAALKIFLTADLEKRVERRYNQLKQKGINATLEAIRADVVERDKRDQERQIAPLSAADDALIIDTSELTVEQVVEKILTAVDKLKPSVMGSNSHKGSCEASAGL